MATQEQKLSLVLLNKISNLLGCHVTVRSVIPNGFTFIPDKVSVPDAFCNIYKSGIDYDTMTLCQAKTGQYWIEITHGRFPYRTTKYWDGKKYKDYK